MLETLKDVLIVVGALALLLWIIAQVVVGAGMITVVAREVIKEHESNKSQ
jgi:hypothetical protein